ncbi:unnamed protein product [Echinostoma caproni]|uniref:BAG domain-containing protein n=1 Tax=Echinostoma caproni TaxID=27848 RepID=A0A183AGS4_9TREM|nr:unnamed protein product [Echinostoma caproni]
MFSSSPYHEDRMQMPGFPYHPIFDDFPQFPSLPPDPNRPDFDSEFRQSRLHPPTSTSGMRRIPIQVIKHPVTVIPGTNTGASASQDSPVFSQGTSSVSGQSEHLKSTPDNYTSAPSEQLNNSRETLNWRERQPQRRVPPENQVSFQNSGAAPISAQCAARAGPVGKSIRVVKLTSGCVAHTTVRPGMSLSPMASVDRSLEVYESAIDLKFLTTGIVGSLRSVRWTIYEAARMISMTSFSNSSDCINQPTQSRLPSSVRRSDRRRRRAPGVPYGSMINLNGEAEEFLRGAAREFLLDVNTQEFNGNAIPLHYQSLPNRPFVAPNDLPGYGRTPSPARRSGPPITESEVTTPTEVSTTSSSFPIPSSKPTPTPSEQIDLALTELAEIRSQIDTFSSTTKNKTYLYLEDRLDKLLLKFDGIETGGDDSVRRQRKQAVRETLNAISVLENKLAPNEQTTTPATSSGNGTVGNMVKQTKNPSSESKPEYTKPQEASTDQPSGITEAEQPQREEVDELRTVATDVPALAGAQEAQADSSVSQDADVAGETKPVED